MPKAKKSAGRDVKRPESGRFLTDHERSILPKEPPEGARRAEREAFLESRRKAAANAVLKARGALADLAWLMLVLPPEKVREIVTSGDGTLTDLERTLMESNAKVGWDAMPPPYARGREFIAQRHCAAIQGGLAPLPGARGPVPRVVLQIAGYEPDADAMLFLPSATAARLAPPRPRFDMRRARRASKESKPPPERL